MSISVTVGKLLLITSAHGFTYPCLFSSNPTRNINILYCDNCSYELASIPSLNIFPTKSPPVVSFLVVTKKSIVLNSGGFHLKECSQVNFLM